MTQKNEEAIVPVATPHPKAQFEDQDEIFAGKAVRRLNSQEFEQIFRLEDPSTAQDSNQHRANHIILHEQEKTKPVFFNDLAPPEAAHQNLGLIVRNFERNSFDFMESKT